MSERYCVFGHPVAHSKSPAIHAAFAAQCGDDISYHAIEAPLDDFAGAWRDFVADGGRGANVTVPFKEAAFALCDTLSQRARRAGAVNTLILGGNGLTYGDTTDGVGLVRDLQHHGVALAGARILVLGAGGAVRGVLAPLLAEAPARLCVANRTAHKAAALAADFGDLGEVTGGGYAVAVETRTPAVWERWFDDVGATTTRRSLDGDDVPSVVARFPDVREAYVFVHDLHLEVGR